MLICGIIHYPLSRNLPNRVKTLRLKILTSDFGCVHILVIWVVITYIVGSGYQLFGGTCRFHLQGQNE
jgi:hypothetical protein